MKNNDIVEQIKSARDAINQSEFLRIAGFADVINRFIGIELKEKFNWLKVFSLIVLINRGGTLTPGEWGNIMFRTNDNMSKLANNLVKEGLVKRYRRGKDRRNVEISVTMAGLDYMYQTLSDIQEAEAQVHSVMSKKELEELERLHTILRVKLPRKFSA